MNAAEKLAERASFDGAALEDLSQLLAQHGSGEELYKLIVPSLSKSVLVRWNESYPDTFIYVLRQFDEVVSGSLKFGHTDTVAEFLQTIFGVCKENGEVRRLALTRLLIMGYNHNRWFVQSIFVDLATSRDDHEHVLMLVELLRSESDAAGSVAGEMLDRSIPLAVREALES